MNIMKQLLSFSFVIVLVFLSACGPNSILNKSKKDFGSEIEVNNSAKTLDAYLKNLAGVSVYGSGPGAAVRLRGSASIQLNTAPLFVIDGVRVGRDFGTVYNMVQMSNVDSVKIIRSSRATIVYGQEGGFGVIEIKTKSTVNES